MTEQPNHLDLHRAVAPGLRAGWGLKRETTVQTKSEQTRQLETRLRLVQVALDDCYDLFAESEYDVVHNALRVLHIAANNAYTYHRDLHVPTTGPDIPDEAEIVDAWMREQAERNAQT